MDLCNLSCLFKSDPKPVEAKQPDAKPVDIKPKEKPVEPKLSDAKPSEPKLSDTKSNDSKPNPKLKHVLSSKETTSRRVF